MGDEGKTVNLMNDIQDSLRSMDLTKPLLSTLAQKGEDELVEMFMSENLKLGDGAAETTQNQLYMASFWGLHDVVKTLLESGADPNLQNQRTQWTPLHGATFQDQGKVIMLLLDKGADPEIEDFAGRTPKDFASASDKVWSLFAAHGCKRTSKQELVEKKVLQRSMEGNAPLPETSLGRKSTASALLRFDDEKPTVGTDNVSGYNAALNGDVLAGSRDKPQMPTSIQQQQQRNKSTEQPAFAAWRS